MQAQTRQSKKGIGKGKVVLSLLLAVGLGIGGYFGATMLLTGQSPITIADDNHVPKSDLPEDNNGNNLAGNSMQNLHAGGLMAMQGEDIFYTNPADGGSLYCRNRDGEITKLTDFAVAGLNVRGEQLIFTGLDVCSITREDGETVTLSADTHEELWAQMGENDQIHYGGHLYLIDGIKSFCEGELSYEELTIAALDSEERYRSPVLMEDGSLLLTVASPVTNVGASPVSFTPNLTPSIIPLSAAGNGFAVHPVATATVVYDYDSVMIVKPGEAMNRVNLSAAQGDRIQNAVAAGNKIFVETVNTTNGSRASNTIVALDATTGKALGTLPNAGTIKSDGENMYFKQDNLLFKFNGRTGKMTQVSHTPCDSTDYEIRPDGSVVYGSVDPADPKNPDTDGDGKPDGEMVSIHAIPEGGGYYASVNPNNVTFKLNKMKIYYFGGSGYGYGSQWHDASIPGESGKPKEKTWVRFGTELAQESIDEDGNSKTGRADSITKLPWSVEIRDKGPNQVHFQQPGEFVDLFSSGNTAPAGTSGSIQGAPGSSQNVPAQDPNAPDPAQNAPDPAPDTSEPAGNGSLEGVYVAVEGDTSCTLTFHSNGTVDFGGIEYMGDVVQTLDYTVSGSTLKITGDNYVSGPYRNFATYFKEGEIKADGSIHFRDSYYIYKKQ